MDDPGATRHDSRAVKDLAAAGLHALRCLLDIGDVEIIKPVRTRQGRRLSEHAADRLPSDGELLIGGPSRRRERPLFASQRARRRR